MALIPGDGGDADQHSAVLLENMCPWLDRIAESNLQGLPQDISNVLTCRQEVMTAKSKMEAVGMDLEKKQQSLQKASAATLARVLEKGAAEQHLNSQELTVLRTDTEAKLAEWQVGKLRDIKAAYADLACKFGKQQAQYHELILCPARKVFAELAAESSQPPEAEALDPELEAMMGELTLTAMKRKAEKIPAESVPNEPKDQPTAKILAESAPSEPQDQPAKILAESVPTEPKDQPAKILAESVPSEPQDQPAKILAESVPSQPQHQPVKILAESAPSEPKDQPAKILAESVPSEPKDQPMKILAESGPSDPKDQPTKILAESVFGTLHAPGQPAKTSAHQAHVQVVAESPPPAQLHRSWSMGSDATTLVPTPQQGPKKSLECGQDLAERKSSLDQVMSMPDVALKKTLLSTLMKSCKSMTGTDYDPTATQWKARTASHTCV